MIRRYRLVFSDALEKIKSDTKKTAWDRLEFYFTPYIDFADTPDKVCLCGAMAGEILALPKGMRDEVKRFFENHQRWLEDILREGREEGLFRLEDSPRTPARLFFGALQGALLVKRTTGDATQMSDVIQTIRHSIEPK